MNCVFFAYCVCIGLTGKDGDLYVCPAYCVCIGLTGKDGDLYVCLYMFKKKKKSVTTG